MQTALIILPVTIYILLTLIISQKGGDIIKIETPLIKIIDAFVKSYIIIFAFIAVSTEILSLFNGISLKNLLVAWLLLLGICCISMSAIIRKNGFSLKVPHSLDKISLILIVSIVVILLVTFATAILYPPNNWDSMTYHMSRVANWISNKNISYYPTEVSAQNYQMPLAEFAIMHIQILAGSDVYANLVQWASFFVVICLSFLIAGELGLCDRQQLISAVVVATLPMAICQASSTQNDLVVSSFLLSFCLFMLRLQGKLSHGNVIFASISLGLSIFTKGTAFLYSAAIGISLAVPVIIECKNDFRRFLNITVALSLIVIIALLLNTGRFWRSYNLYGNPIATDGQTYFNKDISTTTLFSNILRNIGLHIGTPYSKINRYEFRVIQEVLGTELNNPNTTWKNAFFKISYDRHEDFAGNLIHIFILIFGVLLMFIRWGNGYSIKVIWYTVGVLLGMVFYCLIFKWQPWNSRLHTPLFSLASPLIAIIITPDRGKLRNIMKYMIIFFMVLYSFSFAFDNKSRSILSLEWKNNDREKLYFQNRKNMFNDYNSAMNILKYAGVEDVGLYIGADDFEYPFWALSERTGRKITFRHVGVNNVSGALDKYTTLPEYVITTKSITMWKYGHEYTPIYSSENLGVYRKSGCKDDSHQM